MTAGELAEMIRAAQEAAYDLAVKDRAYNDGLRREWHCIVPHGRKPHSVSDCWLQVTGSSKPRHNPYRKV